MLLYITARGETRVLIGGGGGAYSYIRVLLIPFEINLISKEITHAEPKYVNIHPPINALVSPLVTAVNFFEISRDWRDCYCSRVRFLKSNQLNIIIPDAQIRRQSCHSSTQTHLQTFDFFASLYFFKKQND